MEPAEMARKQSYLNIVKSTNNAYAQKSASQEFDLYLEIILLDLMEVLKKKTMMEVVIYIKDRSWTSQNIDVFCSD